MAVVKMGVIFVHRSKTKNIYKIIIDLIDYLKGSMSHYGGVPYHLEADFLSGSWLLFSQLSDVAPWPLVLNYRPPAESGQLYDMWS